MTVSVEELASVVRRTLATGPADDTAVDVAIEQAVLAGAPLAGRTERTALARRLRAEIVGLGAIDALLDDPTVDEVMVNGGREVWIERHGRIEPFARLEPGRIEAVVERIIAPLGLRLDRTHPVVDARLPDGSRLCAVIPPVAPDGLCCSIRRFRRGRLDVAAFAGPAVAELLGRLVAARCNVVVSGATSSGKTTLLNALTAHVPAEDRVVTIEDTAELALHHAHVVRLEARPALADGPPAVGVRELVRAALRLRPDRLVVGEVRGAEALDMVQALNTGHDGSLTTCHANGAADAVRRIEAMVLMGAPGWPPSVVREQVHASVDVVVHVARRHGVHRVVTDVVELLQPDELDPRSARVRVLAAGDELCGPLRRGRR